MPTHPPACAALQNGLPPPYSAAPKKRAPKGAPNEAAASPSGSGSGDACMPWMPRRSVLDAPMQVEGEGSEEEGSEEGEEEEQEVPLDPYLATPLVRTTSHLTHSVAVAGAVCAWPQPWLGVRAGRGLACMHAWRAAGGDASPFLT